jgi:hypothetical protein
VETRKPKIAKRMVLKFNFAVWRRRLTKVSRNECDDFLGELYGWIAQVGSGSKAYERMVYVVGVYEVW